MIVTDNVYPGSPSIPGNDKMMADKTRVPIFDFILVLHDVVSIPMGSTIPARLSGSYARAGVYYETHENDLGRYSIVTSMFIYNNTKGPLSVENIVTPYQRLEPRPGANVVVPSQNGRSFLLPNLVTTSITINLAPGIQFNVSIPW
jgi:hypothetical protein